MNLLTTKDIMGIFKVTRTTVSDWRKQGMPFKKYGKLVRFNLEEVSSWLEKRG
jgi:excisionase family DNA binding protein